MTIIRQFAPADAQAVVDVILPIQQSEFGIAITLEAQPDLQDIPGFYQRDNGTFWVAESEGAVVGTIARIRGVDEIYLGTTGAFLAAHRFYEKNGFTELPRRGLPDAFPVMAVDSKFYVNVLG